MTIFLLKSNMFFSQTTTIQQLRKIVIPEGGIKEASFESHGLFDKILRG